VPELEGGPLVDGRYKHLRWVLFLMRGTKAHVHCLRLLDRPHLLLGTRAVKVWDSHLLQLLPITLSFRGVVSTEGIERPTCENRRRLAVLVGPKLCLELWAQQQVEMLDVVLAILPRHLDRLACRLPLTDLA